jgi:hypothetical protein
MSDMGVRLFKIETDGAFREYVQTGFQIEHREEVLETWIENNPEKILEDGKLLIIGRQVATDLGGYIDLLGVDREGSVVVLELKRDRTPRETLAQAMEYAAFAESLSSEQLDSIFLTYMEEEGANLALYHKEYFKLTDDEAVVFNQDQRIVIVGQKITAEIQQTSRFMRKKGLRVTCLEFSFFKTESGERLMSVNPIVGSEPTGTRQVRSVSAPTITEEQFLSSLDDNGRPVFIRLLDHAKAKGYTLHWGTKGLSINRRIDGTNVPLCYGYPPHAVYKQSVYTPLVGGGGLLGKVARPGDARREIDELIRATKLFEARGQEWRCGIERSFGESEIDQLVEWIDDIARTVDTHGLRSGEEDE